LGANNLSYIQEFQKEYNRLSDLDFEDILSSDLQKFASQQLCATKSLSSKISCFTKIDYRQWKKTLRVLEFIVLLMIAIARTYRGKSNSKEKIDILFGISQSLLEKPSKMYRISNFINVIDGRDKNCNFLIIEFRGMHGRSRTYNQKVVFDVGLELYTRFLTRKQKIQLLRSVFRRFRIYRRKHLTQMTSLVLLKEYCFYEPILNEINGDYIENLITTQSHALVQPLIFHKLERIKQSKTSMLWYSSNNEKIILSNLVGKQVGEDNTWLQIASISKHYVWTQRHKLNLELQSPAEICAVGPVIFHEKVSAKQNFEKLLGVLIFDVTPRNDLPESNIYATRYVTAFLNDILSSLEFNRSTGSVMISLKPKRIYDRTRSRDYVSKVRGLSKKGIVHLLHPRVNLYSAMNIADLIICYPFTSPALIGASLGKRVIYYVPEIANEFWIESSYEGIEVIKGTENLNRYLEKFLPQ
jgi:hypothetical protein